MDIDLSSSVKKTDCSNDTMLLSGVEDVDLCSGSSPNCFRIKLCSGDSRLSGIGQLLSRSSSSATTKDSNNPLHAEVCVSPLNCQEFAYIESHVVEFLRCLGPRHVPSVLSRTDNDFDSVVCSDTMHKVVEVLNNSVASISLMLDETDGADGNDAGRSVDLCTVPLLVYIYQLVNGDEALPVHEVIEMGSDSVNGGTTWLLPSTEMTGLWESLIFDSDVKLNLLQYAQTALLFANHGISSSVISLNRVILLYGPPGTGKTSLCRALANKLAIRMAHRYSSTQLIEINTMNLMSKWFSESARLVARMFDTIKSYLECPDHLVCLLVDEVESLTAVRSASSAGCEPSDAIRVVNAVLTQIDQIKRFPNVLILASSNVTGVIDPAFLDRADIRLFIGPPSAAAIYTIYRSCLDELGRVGLVSLAGEHERLVSYQSLKALQFAENKNNLPSLKLWHLSEQSHGLNGRTLRKLPLLAYAFFLDQIALSRVVRAQLDGRLHYVKNGDNSFYPNSHQSNGAGGAMDFDTQTTTSVSLDRFIDALSLCVEGQFAEIKALNMASIKGGRSEHLA